MKNKPFLVGITGGIGSGKSIVCKLFAILGIPTYDADSRAKWLTVNNKSLKSAICNAFGEQAYDEQGRLNRQYLSEQVFHDAQKLQQLNGLIHPRVSEDFQQWVLKYQGKAPYLIKEAALLIESGSYRELDTLINVTASLPLRIKRIQQRDPQRSLQQIEAIIAKQLSEEERKEKSDSIIWNDEKELLIPQVLALHHKLSLKTP